MNGKPVFTLPAKAVINMKSGFAPKLLCDGPTFSTGVACPYSCTFCYVPSVYRKMLHSFLEKIGKTHEEVVIRRESPIEVMRGQLLDSKGRRRFPDPADRRVIYASPATDVAANMDLVKETVEACTLILEMTYWQIRLLSKSNLLPKVAVRLLQAAGKGFTEEDVMKRMIFGVSTGTLDDKEAWAFEVGTPKVSKRIESLHCLQDAGFRTYGMICPSLPQRDYRQFSAEMKDAIRVDKCEHVWAEVMNVRGESMKRTVSALQEAGFEWKAEQLQRVSVDKWAWEDYSRQTFLAHAEAYEGTGKLRFLQYVNETTRPAWAKQQNRGAVLL